MKKIYRALLLYLLSYSMAVTPLSFAATASPVDKELDNALGGVAGRNQEAAGFVKQYAGNGNKNIADDTGLVTRTELEGIQIIRDLVARKKDLIAEENAAVQESLDSLDAIIAKAKENSDEQGNANEDALSGSNDINNGTGSAKESADEAYQNWKSWQEDNKQRREEMLSTVSQALENFKKAINILDLGEFKAEIEVLRDLTTSLEAQKQKIIQNTGSLVGDYQGARSYDELKQDVNNQFIQDFDIYFEKLWAQKFGEETDFFNETGANGEEVTVTKDEYRKRVYQNYYRQNYSQYEIAATNNAVNGPGGHMETLTYIQNDVLGEITQSRKDAGLVYAAKDEIRDKSNQKADEAIEYAKKAKELALSLINKYQDNGKLIEDQVASIGAIAQTTDPIDSVVGIKDPVDESGENMVHCQAIGCTDNSSTRTNIPVNNRTTDGASSIPVPGLPGVAEHVSVNNQKNGDFTGEVTEPTFNYEDEDIPYLRDLVDQYFGKIPTGDSNWDSAHRKLYVLANTVCAATEMECKPIGDTDSPAYHLFTAAAAIYLAIEVGQKADYKKSIYDANYVNREAVSGYDGMKFNEQIRAIERAMAIREMQVDMVARMNYSNDLLYQMFELTVRQAALEIDAREKRIVAAEELLATAQAGKEGSNSGKTMAMIIIAIGVGIFIYGLSQYNTGKSMNAANPGSGDALMDEGRRLMKIGGGLIAFGAIILAMSKSSNKVSHEDIAKATQELELAKKHGYLRCTAGANEYHTMGLNSETFWKKFRNPFKLMAQQSDSGDGLVTETPNEEEEQEPAEEANPEDFVTEIPDDPGVQGITDGLGIVTDQNNENILKVYYQANRDTENTMAEAFENPLARWRYIYRSITLSIKMDSDNEKMSGAAQAYLAKTREVYDKLLAATPIETTVGDSTDPSSAVNPPPTGPTKGGNGKVVPDPYGYKQYDGPTYSSNNKKASSKENEVTSKDFIGLRVKNARPNVASATPETTKAGESLGKATTANVESGNNNLAAIGRTPVSSKNVGDNDKTTASKSVSTDNVTKGTNMIAGSNTRRAAGGSASYGQAGGIAGNSNGNLEDLDIPTPTFRDSGNYAIGGQIGSGGDYFTTPGSSSRFQGASGVSEQRAIAGGKIPITNGKKTLGETSINKRSDVSIFKIVSGRYLKSGYNHLGIE